MRIWFKRIDNKVMVCVAPNGEINKHWPACIHDSDDLSASVVTKSLQNELDKAIANIRQDAYEHGWRDAKNKKRRKYQNFFGG